MEAFIGSIILFAGSYPPRGWSLCNGQVLSISNNQALFSILGTTYGGDGIQTFALPDLQGRVPMGPGNGRGLPIVSLGQKGGQTSVTLTPTNLPAHTHLIPVSHSSTPMLPLNMMPASVAGGPLMAAPPTGQVIPQPVAPSGGGEPVSVQNPFTALNYIICTQGFFPTRD
jgi:microcystin-dependent protein